MALHGREQDLERIDETLGRAADELYSTFTFEQLCAEIVKLKFELPEAPARPTHLAASVG